MRLARFRVVKGVTGVEPQDDLVPVAAFHSSQNGGQQMLCDVDGDRLSHNYYWLSVPAKGAKCADHPNSPEKVPGSQG
jgi:hypothetical protein